MTSTPYSVQDEYLRNTLVTAAEKIEKLLSTNAIILETPLVTNTPIGLRIDVTLEQKNENGPLIIKFVYMMDTLKFKEWVKSHTHLMEGYAAMFSVKGINIWCAGKASNTNGQVDWEQSAFCIGDKDQHGNSIYLKLLQKEVTFVVHRNPISKKEWNVFLPDVVAAQSRKNEA